MNSRMRLPQIPAFPKAVHPPDQTSFSLSAHCARPALLKQEVPEEGDQKKMRAAREPHNEARTPSEKRTASAGWLGMYLNCKTCLQLWAEYASATRRMWTPTTPTWEAAEARIQTACEAVTVHAAEPH
jgi:hypothetical protein